MSEQKTNIQNTAFENYRKNYPTMTLEDKKKYIECIEVLYALCCGSEITRSGRITIYEQILNQLEKDVAASVVVKKKKVEVDSLGEVK